jgi:type I restriction enzyme M protein
MSNHWRFTSGKKEKAFQNFIDEVGASVYDLEPGDFKESGTNIQACIVVIDKQHSDNITQILGAIGSYEKKDSKKKEKSPIVPMSESKKAEKEFADMFNSFVYRFSNSEAFCDFLDYCLIVFKWWEPNRDFSYWENKYKELYPKFLEMFNLLGIASENGGEGFHDALGDLFMELVSHGRNGQFFTPDNITDMIAQMVMSIPQNGENVLDPACGSSRMLLSAAKMNRNVNIFGCDNDIACCKMSVINLLLNSLTGEIAWMDSLKMEYHKSWFCYTTNLGGINYPIYDVIEDKEISPLWKRHINTFERNTAEREAAKAEIKGPEAMQPVVPDATPKRKSKKDTAQLILNFLE